MLEFIELTKNKSPKNRGKLRDHIVNSFENLENAGLILNCNTILVDFDGDNIDENKTIDYIDKNYHTLKVITNKGVHFYFSRPKDLKMDKSLIDTISVGGFQVDYKTSNTQYAVVKLNGIVRETNQPLTLDNLPELPPLLYPLGAGEKKTNLSGMREHDGRNEGIFKHLCSVQTKYPDIDLNEIAEIINSITFSEPLDSNELDRTVESVKSYYDPNEYHGDYKDMIAFAQWIIPKLNIILYNANLLYFQDNNKFVNNDKLLLKKITQFLKLKRAQDEELLYQVQKFADEEKARLKELPILLKNGAIIDGEFKNTDTNNAIPFSPFYLDVEYSQNAYDENVDNFLNDITCNRQELRKTLEELLGHILLTNKFPHHVFFLAGGGNNGKSTFLEMLNDFVGDLGQNLSLDLFNDNTSVATLNGKLCNCSDETDFVYIDKCKGFKSLASGNTIAVRPIYSKKTVKVQNTATLILSANKMPHFKDKTEGFFRRLMIIPFDFNVTKINEKLGALLSTDNAKSYILKLALNGVQSIKSNGYKMSENEFLKEAKEEYIEDTDSVAGFMLTNPEIENVRTNIVYTCYQAYCHESDIHDDITLTMFTQRLRDYGYKSKVSGSGNFRIYVKTKK